MRKVSTWQETHVYVCVSFDLFFFVLCLFAVEVFHFHSNGSGFGSGKWNSLCVLCYSNEKGTHMRISRTTGQLQGRQPLIYGDVYLWPTGQRACVYPKSLWLHFRMFTISKDIPSTTLRPQTPFPNCHSIVIHYWSLFGVINYTSVTLV